MATMTARDAAKAAIIAQVKKQYKGQQYGATVVAPKTKTCECTRTTKNGKVIPCRYPGKATRTWANQTLRFCNGCVKLWDDVVTKALTGDWGDDNAIQEQSATSQVPRRSVSAQTREEVGQGD